MKTEDIVERAEEVGGCRAVYNGNDTWRVRCPVTDAHTHGDANPSLDVTKGDDGRTLTFCRTQHCKFATIAKALGLKQSDFFERHRNGKPTKPAPEQEPAQDRNVPTMTLVDLAQAKGFGVDWLQKSFGLKPFGGSFGGPITAGVVIPYHRGKGHRPWIKKRLHLKGADRFRYVKGHSPDLPYNRFAPDGDDTLLRAERAGELLIAEGETDTWTGERNGIPTLGNPNNNLPKGRKAVIFPAEDITKLKLKALYLSQDRSGGDKLIEQLLPELARIHYKGKVFIFHPPDGCADLNELWTTCLREAAHKKTFLAEATDAEIRQAQRAFKVQFRKCLEPVPAKKLAEAAKDVSADAPSDDGEQIQGRSGLDTGTHDNENAERFINQHGDKVKYVTAHKTWLLWDGVRWNPDRLEQIVTLAKQTVRSIFNEAAQTTSLDTQKMLVKHAIRSNNSERIMSMLRLAQPDLAIDAGKLDRDAHLLNVANGTINLKTKELQPHRKEDLITNLIPIAYNPKAKCKRWLKFLLEIFGDVAGATKQVKREASEMRDYVQDALGYSFSGEESEFAVFFQWGSGNNGKSVFRDTIFRTAGSYGQNAPPNFLMEGKYDKDSDAPTPGLARLRGKRIVFASESKENARLDTAKVKILSDIETLTACEKYGHPFEFQPTHHIWQSTNHKPIVSDETTGIWKRLKLIPHEVTFTKDGRDGTPKQDTKLVKTLRA